MMGDPVLPLHQGMVRVQVDRCDDPVVGTTGSLAHGDPLPAGEEPRVPWSAGAFDGDRMFDAEPIEEVAGSVGVPRCLLDCPERCLEVFLAQVGIKPVQVSQYPS